MEIAEVQDRESLERYLEALPEDERREVAVRVAFRAAARVLPIAALNFALSQAYIMRDLTAVSIFGALSIAGVAALTSTPAIATSAADNASFTATAAADGRKIGRAHV